MTEVITWRPSAAGVGFICPQCGQVFAPLETGRPHTRQGGNGEHAPVASTDGSFTPHAVQKRACSGSVFEHFGQTRGATVRAKREHKEARATPPGDPSELERDLQTGQARNGGAAPRAARSTPYELAGVGRRNEDRMRTTVPAGLPGDGLRAAGHRRQRDQGTTPEPRPGRHGDAGESAEVTNEYRKIPSLMVRNGRP
jgi:hypothetical protein